MVSRPTIPIAATVLLLLSPDAQAAPGRYLCADDQSVGLHYDRPPGRWNPHAFVPARYVLRKLTLEDQDTKVQKYARVLRAFPEATWGFFEDDKIDPRPMAACRERELGAGTAFLCEPITAVARFDPASRRFQVLRGDGYLAQAVAEALRRAHPKEYADPKTAARVGDPDRPDDLVIEIGTCTDR